MASLTTLIFFALFISIHCLTPSGPGDITVAVYEDSLCTIPQKFSYIDGVPGACVQITVNGATRYAQTTCNNTHIVTRTFTQDKCTDTPTIEAIGKVFYL
jgi:hypothetical protein